jgi:hypothetical protein
MSDFNVRSDSVNVEQIMEQIRSRIRDKRGVDYTEQQIRELAAVKLEKFLDPRGVRSDLLEQFRKAQPAYNPPELPNYSFEDDTLYASTRGPLRWLRKLLNPLLKLFFNPNPLIQALNIQSRLNTMYGEREARREATRRAFDQLQYELMHNLVIETTRMSIEVKNLKMRIESLASRLEFNERRSRALESVVVYKPSGDERPTTPAPQPSFTQRESPARPAYVPQPPAQQRPVMASNVEPAAPAATGSASPAPGTAPSGEGPGQRSRRRRRRRGRRGGRPAVAIMGQPGAPQSQESFSADTNAGDSPATESPAAVSPSDSPRESPQPRDEAEPSDPSTSQDQ